LSISVGRAIHGHSDNDSGQVGSVLSQAYDGETVMKTKNAFAFVLFAAITAVLVSPFATIWALNTLFALGIQYNVWTWLATLYLTIALFGKVSAKSGD
jgi:hypothetical protein